MDKRKIKIAVDIFGGDMSPQVCVDGVIEALKADKNIEVYAVGKKEVVEKLASATNGVIPVCASEVISMSEHPAEAIRAKKDSSIVVGAKLLKSKKVDGFFSAGSTGAILSAATLVTGRIRGIKRPAIGAILPAISHPVLLIDVGANAECKPEMLLQFAKIGCAYMTSVYNFDVAKVGLLNIGEEDEKGNTFSVETNKLLRKKLTNFCGNCEGRDLLTGEFDVVVCDGFTGNVALKTIEGTAKLMMSVLKEAFVSGTKEKISALLLKHKLRDLKNMVDPEEQGGSPLLGSKGVFVVGHGSSGVRGIKNGILETANTVRCDVQHKIENAVK